MAINFNEVIGHITNNANLVILIKILISTLLTIISLFIFGYIYYRINSLRHVSKTKNTKYDWWPLVFPYFTGLIIWIILYFNSKNNLDDIWIYYNIYYLTFNLILSCIFSWIYILSTSIIYFSFLPLSENQHLIYAFLAIYLIFSFMSAITYLSKKYKKYIFYSMLILSFSAILLINYLYLIDYDMLIKIVITSCSVICFLISSLTFYLNNKIILQTNAFFTLSRNIQYDYTFFYNKANSYIEINQLIKDKKLNLFYMYGFNFNFYDEQKITNIQIDVIIKSQISNIISKIKKYNYLAFITYDNNFGLIIYDEDFNKLKNKRIDIENILISKNEINNKVVKEKIKYDVYYTNLIYGLNSRTINDSIKEIDKNLILLKNGKIPNHKNYILDNNIENKNEIKKFINEINLIIELNKINVNNYNYYYATLLSLNPLSFMQDKIYKKINSNPNKTFIERYIAYISFIKFAKFTNKSDFLFLDYPVFEFLSNSQSIINLLNLLIQYKIKKEQIILNINMNNLIEQDYEMILKSIELIKMFKFKVSMEFPNDIKVYNWIKKYNFFINKFDIITIKNDIATLWPKSYVKKIKDLLSNINSEQIIFRY